MAENYGYISIDRKIMNWEWYQNADVFRVFVHLLLSANHKGGKWQGVDIKRGQVMTGTDKLSKSLTLSRQTIRTCISKLKSTGEITTKVTNKYSIITICKYDRYQNNQPTNNQQNNYQSNKRLTNEQPTTNQQLTTNNNDNNENNENNENNYIEQNFVEEGEKLLKHKDEPENWRLEVSRFLVDAKFKFDFCAAKKINVIDLEKRMNDFVIDLNLKMDYKDAPAMKRHFINHYRKHVEQAGIGVKDFKKEQTAFIEPPSIDFDSENIVRW